MGRAILFVAASLASACDGGGPAGDGAVPLLDGASPDGIACPAPPAAPTLGPCPEGWREAAADGITACEPWPETGPPACVPGTMALPGVPGCAPLGAACPSGDLPEEPPTGGPFVYVLAGTSGGDGSRFAPFATIGEAMDFASPGSTILIGRGTYDEAVTPKEGVTLRGLCPRLTVLTRTDAGGAEAIVNVARDGVTLRDLALSGSSRFGIVARAGTTHLEGVVIEDLGAPGIGAADAATITIASSAIRRCAHGLEIIAGGAVELEGSVVADHAGPGIVAIGGTATVRGAWLADNRNAGEPGYGALAEDGGLVTIEGSVVSGNADIGLTAGVASEITARDTVIEDQVSDPGGTRGSACRPTPAARSCSSASRSGATGWARPSYRARGRPSTDNTS